MGLNQSVAEFVEQLSEETITALKIMSEHSISIGVRGERTGEVLDKLSIHNREIIGCPSFYEPYRVLKMAMTQEAPICLQSMMDLPLTLTEGKAIDQKLLDIRYPGSDMKTWELEKYIKEYGHIFYNRREWSEYLVNDDISFSTGARFHGNMMAFTNGIPALWIVHDGRTKELVDTMKLPHILHEELIHFDKVEDLLDVCNYGENFTQNYTIMGKAYVDFLNKNGACHSFKD